MTTFLIILLFAAASLAVIWFFAGKTKLVLIFGAMGILLGLMGYIVQGQPDLPAKNVQSNQNKTSNTGANESLNIVRGFSNSDLRLRQANSFVNASRPDLALTVIQNGLDTRPNDAQLWLGMANILMAQGKGVLAPPAEHAFMKAIRSSPDYPIARFYYGAALIGADRVEEGRKQWLALLDMMPKTGSERDAFIKMMAETGVLDPDELQNMQTRK